MGYHTAITEYIETVSLGVEDGSLDPVKAYTEVYEMIQLLTDLKKEIQIEAINKLDTVGDKYAVRGYKVLLQSRTSWSYEDPEQDRLKQLLKNRQKLAQTSYNNSTKGKPYLVDDMGEIIEPATPKTTTYIKLEAQ